MKGRRYPEENTYYTTHFKPDNYVLDGSDHDDYPFHQMPMRAPGDYLQNLAFLIASRPTQYINHQRDTGISKPSVFLRLPSP
jgi:hypothetical protein